MHPLLDVRPWPRVLLQYPLLVLTAALLGAAGAFAYSYAPLHNAKDWQIEYLEGRLATRTEQVEVLEQELRAAKAADGSADVRQESEKELEKLRAQLEESRERSGALDELEKKVSDLEAELAEAERSRDSWREKHASAEREIESMRAAAAAKPDPIPAAPAPRSGRAAPTTRDAEPEAPAPEPPETEGAPATP